MTMDQAENQITQQENIQTQNNTFENNQSTENKPVDNPQEINWRRFREEREKERKQKEIAEKIAAEEKAKADALKAAMDAILNKPESHNQVEELSEDEKIKKKIEEALAARDRQYEEQRRAREQQELPTKLKDHYPDFENICSNENMDYLQYHYPEVASAFKYAPDNFETWSAVYKAIKRFVPNTDGKKDQIKAEKNLNKPQSMAKPGATPTGDGAPQYLDEKRKAENWKRMQRVGKVL